MEEPEKYCFKSKLFLIEKGEDEETNPCIYGKNFSKWLADRLVENGYPDAVNDPEDWGWAVSVATKPFYLFAACSSFLDHQQEIDCEYIPLPDEVVWQCYISVEKPFFRNPFRKLEAGPAMERLKRVVFDILDSTDGITRVPEP